MSKMVQRFQQKTGREDSEPKPLEPISEREAIQQQVAALTSVWNKSSLRARRAFLTRIDSEF
jgi:hypothetical protein